MKTYLSGIQASGRPHLGNYFGAIRGHVEASRGEGEHFYFVADYHALTTVEDPAVLRERTLEVVVTYLACGLDPESATLFRQSDVPEVTELTWLLSCVTGMGLLERAHSYKDKLAKGVKPSVGLFTYPILMASDILAYDATHVPVGKDQIQHVEMTQDMAGYFNSRFGNSRFGNSRFGNSKSGAVFTRPEAVVHADDRVAKVPGLDGQKMSKSYGNDIWLFETGKKLKKRVNQFVTDSRPPEEPKDPDELAIFGLLRLFLAPDELADWEARVRAGGEGAPGYGHLKVRLVEAIEDGFADIRARREELLADKGEVERILRVCGERARERARATRDRALAACGLR